MSYEIKAEIDGKEYTFESDTANPSEKDILGAIGDYHKTNAETHQVGGMDIVNSAMTALKPNLAEAATGGLSSAPDVAQRVTNFLQNKANPPGTTLLTMAANRPDLVGMAASTAIP